MKSFDLANTADVLHASERAFRIASREAGRSLYSRVPPLEGEDFTGVLGALEAGQLPDSPRLRHWVSTTRGILSALDTFSDPDPSCVSHLFVDDLDARRIYDLHSLRLAEAWIAAALRAGTSFHLQLGTRAPRRIVVGDRGALELGDDGAAPLVVESDGGRLRIAAGSVSLAMETDGEPRVSGNARYLPGCSIRHAVGEAEIPLHDPGLSEPYHANAAIVRSTHAVDSWKVVLRSAIDLLASVDERIASECLQLSPAMLPLHNGGLSFGSASPEHVVGLTYLPAIRSVEEVAECLLHEAMHQKLYRIEECARLFEADSPPEAVYYSPWRSDARPLRMALHGAYVFTGVAEMWAGVALADGSSDDVAARVFLRARQATIAIDVVSQHARPTGIGGRILSGLRGVLSELLEGVALPAAARAEIENRLNSHAEAHAYYVR